MSTALTASPGSFRTTGAPIAVKPAAPAPAIRSPLINAESPSWDGNAPRKSALRWLYVGVTREEPCGGGLEPKVRWVS